MDPSSQKREKVDQGDEGAEKEQDTCAYFSQSMAARPVFLDDSIYQARSSRILRHETQHSAIMRVKMLVDSMVRKSVDVGPHTLDAKQVFVCPSLCYNTDPIFVVEDRRGGCLRFVAVPGRQRNAPALSAILCMDLAQAHFCGALDVHLIDVLKDGIVLGRLVIVVGFRSTFCDAQLGRELKETMRKQGFVWIVGQYVVMNMCVYAHV